MANVETTVEAHGTPSAAIFQIPVVKAKQAMEINFDELDIVTYQECLKLGAKALLNRGMTKVTADEYPDVEERQAAAWQIAEKNLENMKTGNIRVSGGRGASKISGKVMTEARRIARNLVKDQIKANGMKVSLFEASEITKAANAIIAANPEIVEQAKEELAKREKAKIKGFDIAAIAVSAKKVKAAEAKAAEKQLSAKKAGMVQSRTRPSA